MFILKATMPRREERIVEELIESLDCDRKFPGKDGLASEIKRIAERLHPDSVFTVMGNQFPVRQRVIDQINVFPWDVFVYERRENFNAVVTEHFTALLEGEELYILVKIGSRDCSVRGNA